MEYKERLLNELLELTKKITKLDDYLNGNNTNDKEKQELMINQLDIMFAYRDVLEKRVILEMN